MTYRSLLHRLAKDLDEKELDQEVFVSRGKGEYYTNVTSIKKVDDTDVVLDDGQIILYDNTEPQ